MSKFIHGLSFAILGGSILLLSWSLAADPHPALHVATLIRVGLIIICAGSLYRTLN